MGILNYRKLYTLNCISLFFYYEIAFENEVASYMFASPGNLKSCANVGNRSSAPELLDDHLKTVLVNVRLVYLLEREGWDSTPNWEDVLSLGEQQRLGMVSVNSPASCANCRVCPLNIF